MPKMIPTDATRSLARTNDQSPAAIYLAGLISPASRRTMGTALETIARLASNGAVGSDAFPWHELRHEHTAAIRAGLAETRSPATVNKHLSALRGVLRSAWRIGLMDHDAYARAADVKGIKQTTLPRGRDVADHELYKLARACRDDSNAVKGARDAAALALLYGLRRSEVVALDLENFNPDTGRLEIIGGKGRKDRIVHIANGQLDAVNAWLRVRGVTPGPLLCPVSRTGEVDTRRLTTQAVYKMINRRARQAGIDALSPHDLRRTFVGDSLDRGIDLSMVQGLAGHASPTTTARYDRRPEEAQREAVQRLAFPYIG